MILQTANGPKEIKVADLDFTNLMCDLEDHDVDAVSYTHLDVYKRQLLLRHGRKQAAALPQEQCSYQMDGSVWRFPQRPLNSYSRNRKCRLLIWQ